MLIREPKMPVRKLITRSKLFANCIRIQLIIFVCIGNALEQILFYRHFNDEIGLQDDRRP